MNHLRQIFFTSLFAFILFPSFVFAAEVNTAPNTGAVLQSDTIQLEIPKPRVNIPGLEFTQILDKKYDEFGKPYLEVPFLGQYIAAVYRYAVAIASIIAIVMIIVGGFELIISGGGEMVQGAKTRIGNAVTGLVIALGSYVLLYAINPELVRFRSLKIDLVETVELTDGEPESYTNLQSETATKIKREDCTPDKLENIAKLGDLGETNGRCLAWVKKAFIQMCGGLPEVLQKQRGAWDVAATAHKDGDLKPCEIKESSDGIKDGDLVFMATKGSAYIKLWDNFVSGPNGCTVADARKPPVAVPGKNYTTPVKNDPQGMPPVTHIGIYYKGNIYHFTGKSVQETKASTQTDDVIDPNPDKDKPKNAIWKDIVLDGKLVENGGYFIAGYASWQ